MDSSEGILRGMGIRNPGMFCVAAEIGFVA